MVGRKSSDEHEILGIYMNKAKVLLVQESLAFGASNSSI